eukprot:gene29200-35245_t
MDARAEDSIRAEISAIEAIAYAQRSADDKKRLNDLEAEIRRRHPELYQGGAVDGQIREYVVHLKYGKAIYSWPLNEIGLDHLRSLVMDRWDVFYLKEFHLECEDRKVDATLLEDLLKMCDRVKKYDLHLTVVSDCLGFSDYKREDEYLKIENILKIENEEIGEAEVDLDEWSHQISHAVQDLMNKILLYGPVNKTCEASVREHVSPVLSLAALIAGDIKMRAEQRITGLRGSGPLDYLFLYKRFPITITEVKDEDLMGGVAQNDAQLVAGRQVYKYELQIHFPDELREQSKKRKYLEIDISSIPSFGIVSSGRDWMFQRLVEGKTEGERTTIYKSQISCINLITGDRATIEKEMLVVVRKLVWILTQQKDAVDSHQVAKRVRNEL